MAAKLKVTYVDGKTEVVLVTPRVQIQTEAALGGVSQSNKLAATYRLAWTALHKSGREAAGFDEWIDLIDDVEEYDDEESVDPTQSDLTIDESSN